MGWPSQPYKIKMPVSFKKKPALKFFTSSILIILFPKELFKKSLFLFGLISR